jgi:hypothetical protein
MADDDIVAFHASSGHDSEESGVNAGCGVNDHIDIGSDILGREHIKRPSERVGFPCLPLVTYQDGCAGCSSELGCIISTMVCGHIYVELLARIVTGVQRIDTPRDRLLHVMRWHDDDDIRRIAG